MAEEVDGVNEGPSGQCLATQDALDDSGQDRTICSQDGCHGVDDGGRVERGVVEPRRVCEWKEGAVENGGDGFFYSSRQRATFERIDKGRREVNEDGPDEDSMDEFEKSAKKFDPDNWRALAENLRCHRDLNRDSYAECKKREQEHSDPSRMMPFGVEAEGRDGTWYRKFVAATYGSIMRKLTSQRNSHFYELIRDGWPCHLYFDLEYGMEGNEHVDGARMVDNLLWDLDIFLKECLNLALEDSFILEMDSSSPTKFSRHIIVRFEGCAFKDSCQLKNLVHCFLSTINTSDFEAVARKMTGDTKKPIVDVSVYSRNRLFRTIWSSKGGQERKLQETNRYSLRPPVDPVSKDRIFELSLICNVDPEAELITFSETGINQRNIKDHAAATPSAVPESSIAQFSTLEGTSTLPFHVFHNGRSIKLKQIHPVADPQKLLKKAVDMVDRIEEIAMERSGGRRVEVNSICLCGKADEVVSYGLLGPGSHYCERIDQY